MNSKDSCLESCHERTEYAREDVREAGRRRVLTSAVATVLGLGTAGAVQALDVTGWELRDFNGILPAPGGTQFTLPPDVFVNCTGTAGCGTEGFGYSVETLTSPGGGDFGVVLRYTGTVPGQPHDDFPAEWRIEGVISTVPLPAAVWLFSAGLLGLLRVARRKPV